MTNSQVSTNMIGIAPNPLSQQCNNMSISRSSDKPAGGDDDDDVQLPPPDAQFSKETGGKKSKKGKRIKKQKPYNKRQSKIQNLDPLFICKYLTCLFVSPSLK